jgi:hypothetical protein
MLFAIRILINDTVSSIFKTECVGWLEAISSSTSAPWRKSFITKLFEHPSCFSLTDPERSKIDGGGGVYW